MSQPVSSYQSIEQMVQAKAKAKAPRTASKRKNYALLTLAVASLAFLGLLGFATGSTHFRSFYTSMGASSLAVTAHATPGCVYADGQAITAKNKLLDTPLDDEMVLQFSFKIDAATHFGDVVWVGDQNDNEWPAVFFSQKNGQDTRLIVKFDKEGASTQYFHKEETVEAGKEYLLRVHIKDLACTISLNGEVTQSFEIPSEFKPSAETASFPVYASSPFSLAASGSIWGLGVCAAGAEPESCRRQSGEIPLSMGNSLFRVRTAPSMEVSFTLVIHAPQAQWSSILHVADVDIEAQPGFWSCHTGLMGGKCFSVVVRATGNNPHVLVPIEFGQTYDVRVVIEPLQTTVFMDGVETMVLDYTSASRVYGDEVPVYASNPWYLVADATLSDLSICYPEPTPARPASAECFNVAGPSTLAVSNKLGEVNAATVDNLDIFFRLAISSSATAPLEGRILRVGAVGETQLPLLWLREGKLRMQFEKLGGGMGTSYVVTDGGLVPGGEYDVQIQIRDLRFYVRIDGELLLEGVEDDANRPREDGLAVYFTRFGTDPGVLPGTVSEVEACWW